MGLDLAENIYKCTKAFPRTETFGLVSQMRRAAVSIPSNIAEGQTRRSSKEFLQFIYVALGSLAELETQLELATRFNYGQMDVRSVMMQVNQLGRKLHCLQRSIRSKLNES